MAAGGAGTRAALAWRMRYHPRVSEPVLDPAEARAQFRCCPRCGAALATPGACPLVCTACRFAYYFNVSYKCVLEHLVF